MQKHFKNVSRILVAILTTNLVKYIRKLSRVSHVNFINGY